jgi:cytochrome c biogenesis protein CcmG, thiol:disulfide interchange protein DsbE
MIKGWHFALVAGVVGLLALFYQGLWGDPKAIPTVLVGTSAQNFVGPDLYTGEEISLDQFQGKVVVLNFWASWCYECRIEHENLLAIQERFGNHPDFVMLGVDFQDQQKDALKYLEVYGSNFNHVRDVKGTISIDYGVYGVPETFVLDQQGIIRFKHIGPIMGPVYTYVMNSIIEPLLQGQPITAL